MPASEPNPGLFFDTLSGYQRAYVLNAALDIGLFTAIADGFTTPEAIATHTHSSPRGVRILCDHLTVQGFLTKTALPPTPAYALTQDSAVFLNEHSPAYVGAVRLFFLNDELTTGFRNATKAVRTGRTALTGQGTVDFDDPVWKDFARAMMPMMMPSAVHIAQQLATLNPCRVLDIAASHGAFGISIVRANPAAHVTALDFPRRPARHPRTRRRRRTQRQLQLP